MPKYSDILVTLTLALIFGATTGQCEEADETKKFEQSHLSCSIITSEHLTALQLYQRGLPLKDALASLPNIRPAAKKRVEYIYSLAKSIGILNAYSDINTNYARCSTLVYKTKGLPAADQRERGYYFCAGENKIRYELILHINQQKPLEKIFETVPFSHQLVAQNYYQLIQEKGVLAAFDLTANNLKTCLKQLD